MSEHKKPSCSRQIIILSIAFVMGVNSAVVMSQKSVMVEIGFFIFAILLGLFMIVMDMLAS